MCGRYFIAPEDQEPDMRELARVINRKGLDVRLGDIHPGDRAPVLLSGRNGICVKGMRWQTNVINARAETAGSKPMFRADAESRHLLLPCSGFYEWKHVSGQKDAVRYFCKPQNGMLLFMAGLYNEQDEFVVLTQSANDIIAPVHHRMPLFIDSSARRSWLQGQSEAIEEALEAQPPMLDLVPQTCEQMTLFSG